MDQQTQEDELGRSAKAFASARAAFREALDDTTDVERLLALVRKHGFTEQDISTAALRRILALDYDHLRARTMLGHIAVMFGDYVEAYACYRRAERIAPDDKEVLHLKAVLSLDWDERISACRRIVELYPDDEYARENLRRSEAVTEKDRWILAWPPGQHPPE